MIQDTISLRTFIEATRKGVQRSSLVAFINFIEKQFGGSLVIDSAKLPFGRGDLLSLFGVAQKLIDAGVIVKYQPVFGYADEPLQYHWTAEYNIAIKNQAGGMSVEGDAEALTATLAEGLERYLWFAEHDFLVDTVHTSVSNMHRSARKFIDPESFVGFTKEQRTRNTKLTLKTDSVFLWTAGYSWTMRSTTYIPAQTIMSGSSGLYKDEPVILVPITTGLATWPTKEGAVLAGALEVIERDAYMITWLNQLPLPRLNIVQLALRRPSLAKLLETCARYGFIAQATRLPTDAPAYVVCASVEDESGMLPRFTIGLKAHRDLARAVEGALLEALRMHQNVRTRREKLGAFDLTRDKHSINHMDRTLYWAEPDNVDKILFLSGVPSDNIVPLEPWDDDSETAHLDRVVAWANKRKYDIVSVSLGASKKNVSPWHVEMVVIPQLQPMHQNEKMPYLGGSRLEEIPTLFGYTPLSKPFNDEPHPFA